MICDVVIVGAGPTGLWTACELALAGVKVAVLEKLAEPTGLSKALGLQSRTLEMLAYRGILDRFTADNPVVPFLNFAMFPLDPRRIDFPHPLAVVIPQARVEALLAARAQELGAEIRRGNEVTALSQDAQSVRVSVRTNSGIQEITARYVVGCDGGHSVVRKQLDVAFPGVEPTIVGHMGDVKLQPGALELLKRNLPELGGREFGIARTQTGNFAIVPLGSKTYRIAAIEWDRDLGNSDGPMRMSDLEDAIRRVTGIDLPMEDPIWLSRPTDSSRLVEHYRVGRVFLAGDAAHVHWAYGGKGLQTGMQDAGNLGWKLAAQVQGWAPPELLDSYHSERHPVGQRLITLTRAQEALARPGEHVTALRAVFDRILAHEAVFRQIVEEVSDVDMCYPMDRGTSEPHPLVGKWAPDLRLQLHDGTTHLAAFMSAGKGAFVDLSERSALSELASRWQDRLQVAAASCPEGPPELEAMLVRPDGYVAWARRPGEAVRDSTETLRDSLRKWFGAAA